jgi:hypothetical protein
MRIIAVLEDELCFLHQFAASRSLQEIVFPHEGKIPSDFREKLIQHCAKVGQFIEQTVPRLSVSVALDSLHPLKTIDSNKIFNLIKGVNLSERIESVQEIVKSSDAREIFDLFVAEVIMSSILRRYAVEVNLRLSQAQTQLSDLRGISDRAEDHKQNLERAEIRERSIRDLIARVFAIDPGTDLAALVEAVLRYFTTEQNTLPVVANLQSRISRTKQQYSEKAAGMKRTYKRELHVLEKSLRQTAVETERQIKSLQAEVSEKDAAVQRLNQQASESTKRLEVLNTQLENRERYEQEQRK